MRAVLPRAKSTAGQLDRHMTQREESQLGRVKAKQWQQDTWRMRNTHFATQLCLNYKCRESKKCSPPPAICTLEASAAVLSRCVVEACDEVAGAVGLGLNYLCGVAPHRAWPEQVPPLARPGGSD